MFFIGIPRYYLIVNSMSPKNINYMFHNSQPLPQMKAQHFSVLSFQRNSNHIYSNQLNHINLQLQLPEILAKMFLHLSKHGTALFVQIVNSRTAWMKRIARIVAALETRDGMEGRANNVHSLYMMFESRECIRY